MLPVLMDPGLEWRDALLGLAATLPISLLALCLGGVRLAGLLKGEVTIAQGFAANAFAVALFPVLPGRLSELAKPALFALEPGIPLARGLAAVAMERLLDAAFLLLLMIVAAIGFLGGQSGQLASIAFLLAGLLLTGAITIGLLAARPRLALKLLQRLPGPWLRRQARLMLGVALANAGGRSLGMALGLSALLWATSYLIFLMLLAVAAPLPLTAAEILAVFIAGTLGLVVTVTPGGIGTFEGAVALSLMAYGCRPADALLLALLLRVVVVLPAVPVAVWWVLARRLSLSRLVARIRAAS
jgi:uncharacterized membrane protein YbhN (UPF0104 family)